ncbi:PH domain-containing protein [Nocardioides sp. GCM10027113]|uniref:PH domain-containing protein n=1 Tax=unclassified Nocardioides TaxID=2615069 RepID=UPI00361A9CF6
MLLPRPRDPDIGKHLLHEEGEVVVDVVHHHWVAYTVPLLESAAAVLLLGATAAVPVEISSVPFFLALGLFAHAAWGAARERRDRFVITNMRVFRIHGVLSQRLATMPLHRILDITVVKPFHGRLLGFGHFVFESAAQEQGLREIRYVGRPNERDLAIQRVVQRSGLRGPRTGR